MAFKGSLIVLALTVAGSVPLLSSCVVPVQSTSAQAAYGAATPPGYPAEWRSPRFPIRGKPNPHRHFQRHGHHH